MKHSVARLRPQAVHHRPPSHAQRQGPDQEPVRRTSRSGRRCHYGNVVRDRDSPWGAKSVPVRDLRVLVDRDTVEADSDGLLDMLLSRDRVELTQFSDEGPPPDAEMLDTEVFGSAAIGWITLGPAKASAGDPFAGRSLRVARGTTLHMETLLDYSVERLD